MMTRHFLFDTKNNASRCVAKKHFTSPCLPCSFSFSSLSSFSFCRRPSRVVCVSFLFVSLSHPRVDRRLAPVCRCPCACSSSTSSSSLSEPALTRGSAQAEVLQIQQMF